MSISFKMTLPQKLLKYREYSRHFWVDSFQNKCQKTQRNLMDSVLRKSSYSNVVTSAG